ncbi:hypothetical protein KKF84_11170, partial [Myxococcota bacterium]|nr:hypothetical protein [Myxococcota bacterium]
ALELELPVNRVLVPEVVSVSGETTTAVRQRVDALKGVQRQYGGLELTLSSTALSGVEDGMEQLVSYPYGCMEQKTSRLLPMIALLTMGNRFRMKAPKNTRRFVEAGLMDILTMQRRSGGFAYWPSPASREQVWTTAYALIVFARLKEAKINVPSQSVVRAISYLRRFLRNDAKRGYYHFSERTLVLLALSLHNVFDTREALKLFALREYRPLFAKASLLMALAAPKQTKPVAAAVKTLLEEIGSHLSVDGDYAHAVENLGWAYQGLMHSDDRSTAVILMALARLAPKHIMVARMVRYFLKGRKNARFRNTQEAAWALMAMMDYARFVEKEVPDFTAAVWLGSRLIARAVFAGRDLTPRRKSIPMASLLVGQDKTARDLVFARKGTGRLYYGARLRYARSEPPSVPLDRGFSVSRVISLLGSDGGYDSRRTSPRVGDTVEVRISVTTSAPRKFVVIDDPLPAGMEAIDTTFAISAKTFGARRVLATSHYDHRELRDDRVLHFIDDMSGGTYSFRYLARVTSAGNFVSPPARVEEMYNPEVFGYTATTWFNYTR